MGTAMTWTRPAAAVVVASALAVSALPALAQEGTPSDGRIDLTNAPVDMHEGTCANPTLDPWDEIGRLQRQEFPTVVDELHDDLGVADDADPAADPLYLTEDLDGDGVLDEGEDLNENGILDEGLDLDEDGLLADDEILADGDAAVAIINYPDVWVARGAIDASFESIFNQPNVIAVHQSSEQYETIVACGNVGGVDADVAAEEVVVGLGAADGSGIRGYAILEEDDDLFGDDTIEVTVYLFDGLPSARDQLMAGTPTP